MPLDARIRAALGDVPDLSQLVDAAFLARFQLAPPMQYGMVCRDVAASVDQLEALGAGPFLHATTSPPGWTERGERRRVRTELALGYAGGQQIELLGAGEHTSFYAEKIPQDGSPALHHVGIAQAAIGPSRRALEEAGFAAVVQMGLRLGPFYSIDVAYFDTRDEVGCYIELLEFTTFGRHTPFTERMVSRLGGLQKLLVRRNRHAD